MNTEDHELENMLRQLPQPDPTPRWKAAILATASAPALPRPPVWLLGTWAACWVAVALLQLSMRGSSSDPSVQKLSDSPLVVISWQKRVQPYLPELP